MHRIWLLLLPELRQFAGERRAHALHEAAHAPHDVPELVASALAVVLVAALTRLGLGDDGPPSRLAAVLVNFAVALPLVAACVAPLHVRRLRRGLRAQLPLREGHE